MRFYRRTLWERITGEEPSTSVKIKRFFEDMIFCLVEFVVTIIAIIIALLFLLTSLFPELTAVLGTLFTFFDIIVDIITWIFY